MEALLQEVAHSVALAVEAIAILLIAIGTIEALVNIIRVMFRASTGMQKRAVWLEFARWLVAALTFQLAADIVTTSFNPTWEEVGRLGAIAVVRTFLSYFLDHEVENTRRLQHAAGDMPKAA
ncbi:MAG TPA: DUF1622 domain-containing protein [Candidatus Binatia bacterium]|jgi:uncharacterized membrane protein